MIHRANQAYLNDDTGKYKRCLINTVLLTLIFMLLQIVGWYQLMESNEAYFSASDNARSYLQLISAFHFIHVFAGLPFLVLFYHAAKKRMVEPVSVLVYFSDPEKRLKLKLLTIYWHFLDVLWIYLVLFFFVTGLF
jgi:cytochrome c oxidase subunit 3